MATVTDPVILNTNDGNAQLRELPLRADATSAQAYIEDKGLGSYSSFTSGEPRFSNEYGLAYQWYASGVTYQTFWGHTGLTYGWVTEFGYQPIITTITYS